MPTARYGAVAGVIDGKFYVAGGMDGSNYLSILEVYDPTTDTWTEKASMPSPVGYAVAGVMYGRLYVASGYDGTSFSSNLYVYDPASDNWSIEAQIPTLRYEAAAGVIDNKLYIVSGYYGGNIPQVEIFDPRIGYQLILSSGQVLPAAETSVSVNASNITDWYGNTIASSLDTSFHPITGEVPTIDLSPLDGTCGGDIIISYALTDSEGNPVSLQPEYSIDGIGLWSAATFEGVSIGIYPSSYQGSIIWKSGTDLPNEIYDEILFRIIPKDNETTSGVTDSISFGLDNKPPAWIAAEGASGDTSITFWFDEPVRDVTALITSNISLSDGLTAEEIQAEHWTTGSSMGIPRRGSACAVIDGKLYVVGGTGGDAFDDHRLEVYDPATDTWTAKASTTYPREKAIAEAIDGKLYVAGGIWTYTEVYDPETNTWSTVGSGPQREWSASGVINGKLYMTTWGPIREYNPTTNTWIDKAYIPTVRQGAVAGVINEKLFVAGGETGGIYLTTLEVYDPATDTWTERAPLPSPVGYAAAGVIYDRLYVAGGYDGTSYSSNLYLYNPVTYSW